MRTFLFLFVCSLIIIPAQAQIDTTEIYELEPVTVQATRFEKKDIQSPFAITSLSRSFIQKGLAQLSVNESLDAIPGLFALNANNFAQDLRVSIRGFGARSAFGIRGIKVLVDGLPESTPDGQAQVDNLDLGVLEGIEVIRGPSSGLYGNASGGVISFVTQNPSSNPFWEARILAGSYGLQQYQIKTSQQKGRFGYVLHGIHTKTDGYRENSGMKNTLFNGKFNFQLSDRADLRLLANYADSPQADDPGGINLPQAESDRRSARDRNLLFRGGEAIKQARIGLVYNNEFRENQKLEIKSWYNTRDFNNKLPFQSGGIVAFKRHFSGLGTNYQLHKKGTSFSYRLKVGLDLQNQVDDRQRYNNLEGERGTLTLDQKESFLSMGFYILQEFAFSEKWTGTLGLRYDQIRLKADDQFLSNGDQSGTTTLKKLNPTIGLVYALTDASTIYGNISTSFETPTLGELSNNPLGTGGFNPSLDPQEATNFEVGWKGLVNNKLRYEIALFRIDLKNEIIPFELESFPGRTFYQNAGSSERQGTEISLNYSLTKGLTAFFNYTFSDFNYTDFGSFDGNQLPGIPKHTSFFALNYTRLEGLSGSLQVRNVGKLFANDSNATSVDGYTVINLRLDYEKKFLNWGANPFFGINNLLGAKYFDNIRINAFGSRFYEPAPLTNFYAGLKISLGQ